MATTTNILVLLNFFSSKQKSAIVDFRDFAEYLKKYAEHHVENQSELVQYLGDAVPALNLELDRLVEEKQVVILEPRVNKKEIYVVPYYIQSVAERYTDIIKNPSLPFPLESEMPKSTPKDILTRINAMDYIFENMAKAEKGEAPQTPQTPGNTFIYNLILPHDDPPLLLPSTVPIMMLLDAAFYKLRAMLYKEEYHDYFLKKVSNSNPGKEIGSKTFFNSFVKSNEDAAAILKRGEDEFYFWSQLSYFIRQDYDKVKDKTSEDISILQSLTLIEIALTYHKDKSQQNAQKISAFETLDNLLTKPPYYYTFEGISKFVDSKGVPLTNYFSGEELKEHLKKLNSEGDEDSLPKLLMFKVENGTLYFILKEKVLPVLVKLCTDGRVVVRDAIKKHWHETLLAFDVLPEMKNDNQFEKRLEQEVRVLSPILYAILNSSFLPVVHYETFSKNQSESPLHIVLFNEGRLIPYSEILMMDRAEMLSDAKIMLPFWYSFPFISWILKMILKRPKNKKPKKSKSESEIYREEEEKKRNEDKNLAIKSGNENVSRKVAFHEAARDAEGELVPAGSTLDRELEGYKNQWNVLINKQSNANLTEDVNSLIRDYMRKILRTMNASSFNLERIRSLATSLVETPSLQKIKDHDALNMYIQLYIIKLVKNLPT